MKKIISIIMVCLVTGALFVGCGKYEPKLAETGVQYVSKTNNNEDGSYPGITVKSVTKDGDNIIIKTESPINQMMYAYKKFINFTVINSKGDTSDKNSFKIKEVNQQGEFIVTPGDMKIDDIKYIQIGPYKNGDKDIEFEVK
ncbi:hypothetical protein [Clostridium sardiniense]|uniref:hypothetical protein n=1 Tax=Clostridium sardiniense TaxID=29369 RepID=UPI0019587980|nr:hypothetical protein [Clostridium sardiniense]MBM7836457.1 hypothetical protein [Clostridium sardiniense]